MANQDIAGVWILRAYYREDTQTGERTEPLGPRPKGVLMLHPEGRMVALLTPAEQTPTTTDAERAAAFQNLVAYSGRYRLEPPDRFVTSVDIAWFQPWVGSEQPRSYRFGGDTLDIVSVPRRTTGDAMTRGVLFWVREGSTAAA